jgi:K+ potassium transporter
VVNMGPVQQPALGAASGQRLTAASLATLGIVFGDIGTSPLYRFKTGLNLTGENPDAAAILGSLSLILWTLFLIPSVKYVNCRRIRRTGWNPRYSTMSGNLPSLIARRFPWSRKGIQSHLTTPGACPMTRSNGSWIVGSRAAAGRRFGSHELAMGCSAASMRNAASSIRWHLPSFPRCRSFTALAF